METKSILPVIEHVDYFEVAPGVWGLKDIFVNVYLIEIPGNSWVLVDTGLKSTHAKIKKLATELFGQDSRPSCIILTHGHFDHTGSLKKLLAEWEVPVYAHYMELPYLTGKASYPPADTAAGGGLMTTLAWLFPTGPINLGELVTALPEAGELPFLEEWKYYYTPGHAPGHISLFREKDKVLLAGDAIVTTRQESALSVMFQTKILSGPPRYFTYDWVLARESANILRELEPEVIATGHGRPMFGDQLRKELQNLCAGFFDDAVPQKGRYVNEPAVASMDGIAYLPPAKPGFLRSAMTALLVGSAVYFVWKGVSKSNKPAWKTVH